MVVVDGFRGYMIIIIIITIISPPTTRVQRRDVGVGRYYCELCRRFIFHDVNIYIYIYIRHLYRTRARSARKVFNDLRGTFGNH